MSAILEIPEVRQRVSRLSVEEYHRLNEFNNNGRRTELIRGIVIEKMSKSPLHASIAKRLYDTIARLLPEGLVVRREDGVHSQPRSCSRNRQERGIYPAEMRATNRRARKLSELC